MACTACGQCMGIASSGGGERIAARARARCACSGPADSQPMASDTSTPSLLLTCKRVLQCESTCVAGEARTRAACVTSVLCTRVVVCRAQRGERGRGSGEAKPGARHASLFAVQFFAVQQNAERTYCTAYSQSLSSLVLFLAAVTATPVATLHSVVDAHGAQAILGKIKRTKEHQNNGNAGSFKFASRRR